MAALELYDTQTGEALGAWWRQGGKLAASSPNDLERARCLADAVKMDVDSPAFFAKLASWGNGYVGVRPVSDSAARAHA